MFPGDITALILASLSIIFSFFINYGIYKSVVHYKNLDEDEKPKKLFFSVELLFAIFSSITLKIFAISLIISIISHQHQIITNWGFPVSYGFQIQFLHLLWLNRLKAVFRDSLYQISSFIYYGYIICLLIPWICIILLLILITDVDERLFYCYGSSYILSSIFLWPLFSMFIHKLHKLHHAMNKQGDNTNCSDTLTLFIKTIIISFISIFCTIMLVLSLIISLVITKINSNIKIPIEMIYALLLIDIVKNAICTMLMYRYHENLYKKLFSSLHDKCTTLYSSKCNDNKQIPPTALNTNIELGVKEEEKEKQKEFEISSMHQTIIKQLSVASILGPAQSITEKKSKSKSKSTSKPSKSNYKATKTGEGEDREEGGKEAEEMRSIDILRGTTSMSHISPIDESEESASMTTSNLIGNGSQLCD